MSKQAFSQSRKNLKPETFKLLNTQLLIDYYSDNETNTYKGYRVLGIDGSTALLPTTEQLKNEFGVQGNQFVEVPMARTSVLFDVFNDTTMDAIIAPYKVAENKLAFLHLLELIKIDKKTHFQTPVKNLVMFDRGYTSVPAFFLLKHLGVDFIMRAKTTFTTEITEIVKSGQLDTIITISLYKFRRSIDPDFISYMPDISEDPSMQLRVTVHELNSGEKEILITSLLDRNEFSYDNLFYLYSKRWCVEEGLKLHKHAAEIENFSGESKIAIEQDFYATVFTCNVAALIAQEVAEEVNEEHKTKELKYEYKPNKSIGLGILKEEILDAFLGTGDLEAITNKIKKEMKRNLVAVRPGRSFKRTIHLKSASRVRQKRRHL